nr:hypothetical protein [Morchella crassipes]
MFTTWITTGNPCLNHPPHANLGRKSQVLQEEGARWGGIRERWGGCISPSRAPRTFPSPPYSRNRVRKEKKSVGGEGKSRGGGGGCFFWHKPVNTTDPIIIRKWAEVYLLSI